MITIGRLRRTLGVPVEDEVDLPAVKAAVIALFERQTAGKWNFREDHVENFRIRTNRDPRRTVSLELLPVVAITKVEVKALAATTWTELTEVQWTLDTDGETYARLERVNAEYPELVRVTYDGGYTETTCPGDIANALLVQAKFEKLRNDPTKLVVQSQNFENGAGVLLKPDYHPIFVECVAGHVRKV